MLVFVLIFCHETSHFRCSENVPETRDPFGNDPLSILQLATPLLIYWLSSQGLPEIHMLTKLRSQIFSNETQIGISP